MCTSIRLRFNLIPVRCQFGSTSVPVCGCGVYFGRNRNSRGSDLEANRNQTEPQPKQTKRKQHIENIFWKQTTNTIEDILGTFFCFVLVLFIFYVSFIFCVSTCARLYGCGSNSVPLRFQFGSTSVPVGGCGVYFGRNRGPSGSELESNRNQTEPQPNSTDMESHRRTEMEANRNQIELQPYRSAHVLRNSLKDENGKQ